MRACVDVPAMSGHAHLNTIRATAHYSAGTNSHDVLIVLALALVVAVITAGIVLCNRRSYR